MARIRSVHPGLWTDPDFVGLSLAARLFLIGLWNEADDYGIFEWKPLTLKMRLSPADNLDAAAVLDEIHAAGRVQKIERAGKSYGLVRNFRKYQRPKTPSNPIIPLDLSIAGVIALPDTDPRFPKSTESLPQPLPSPTEIGPLMEDGGDKMEKEERAADAPPPAGKGEEAKPVLPAKQSSCEIDLELPRALDRAADLKDQLFGPCLAWLGERTRKPADKYRSMVGRWIKEWGEAAVLDAFLRARKESPLEPVAWIEGALRAGGRKNGKAAESTGPDWNRRVEDFRARNFWLTSWGAAPTDPGCQAPAPILHQHGYRTEAA